MMGKLMNEKRSELKAMPRSEFIDRILEYPDQNMLNRGQDGKRRNLPLGEMADQIKKADYEMSDKQYYGMMHDFAKLTVPEVKVVGQTFMSANPEEFQKTLATQDGPKSTYEMDYTLRPANNSIMVLGAKEDGELKQIGYMPKGFAQKHPITEDVSVHGTMIDYSNGKFKNVAYRMEVDIEKLDIQRNSRLELTDADLKGLEPQAVEDSAKTDVALTADDLQFGEQLELNLQ